MPSPNIEAALNALIEAIRSELREKYLELLGNPLGQMPVPAKPRPSGPGGKVKGGRRSPEDVEATAKAVLSYVRSNPGQRVEQIAKGLGTSTKVLKLPIIKLLARPAKLTTKGVRRGTTYRVKG